MHKVTIGIDLGDKKHVVCVLNSTGDPIATSSVSNTEKAIKAFFQKYPKSTVAMEAGTHSPWISRALITVGHTVLVGNPRKLRMIWNSDTKSDIRDAEMLARIARFDPGLLSPIHHRGEQAQADLNLIKSRDTLVSGRSKMINFVRSTVKSMGQRITSSSSESFHKKAKEQIPAILQEV